MWRVPLPFEDLNKIHEYFSHEKIQCLLCGRWYKSLGLHLRQSHQWTVKDYKEQFGLPWSRGLNGMGTRRKYQRHAHKLHAQNKLLKGCQDEEHCNKLHRVGERRKIPAHRKYLSKHMKKLGMKRGQPFEPGVCEALEEMGFTHTQIAKLFDTTQSRVSRFLKRGNKYQQQEGGTKWP